jgi:hypothetical protein
MNNIEEILKYIVDSESKKTVGMICKRIELSTGKNINGEITLTQKQIDDLKAQIKEVVYEQARNLRDFLLTGKIILEFKQQK